MDGDPCGMAGRFSRLAGAAGRLGRRGVPRPRACPVRSIVLMSNDYLALSTHPYLVEAQVGALRRHGNGLVMSAAFTADTNGHRQLEDRFAAFLRAPATILCQSGWTANIGLIQAIAPAGVPGVRGRTGTRLAVGRHRARRGRRPRPFPHNDLEYLERLIRQYGAGLIAFDVLYSVTGDLCPLAGLVDLAERTGCRLIADESHTLGVYGPHGAGLTVGLGLTDRVAYRTASLAKTFAGRAGLVACSREMADYLPFHSHGAIFSSTLLPHDLAGLGAALSLIIAADERRARLAYNADRLRESLAVIGYAATAERRARSSRCSRAPRSGSAGSRACWTAAGSSARRSSRPPSPRTAAYSASPCTAN